jgi:hypothetical protein
MFIQKAKVQGVHKAWRHREVTHICICVTGTQIYI